MAKTLKRTIKDMIKDVESATRDPLGRFVTTVPTHRGVDVTYTTGTSTGTHMHVGTTSSSVMPPIRIDDIRKEEYERGKKEALKRIWDLTPNAGQTVVLINTGDSINSMGLSDGSSASQRVLVHRDYLFPENAGEAVPTIVSKAIDELEVGWYQDDKADLYYYEGESHWKEVDLATNKQLTEDAILGKLEYIG